MSEKEASVRLTLKGDGFKRGMSDAEAQARKSVKGMGDHLKSALSEGGKAGIESLKTAFGRLKDVASGFLGIAGGLGMAELARKAMANEGAFRKMAFAIKAGTGELVNWKDLQKEAQATALKTGHTTEEVAASMKQLRDVTGDTSFARKTSGIVAEVATGSHESLESITSLAAGLNEKFGVTDKQMGDTLAQVVSLGDAGGVTVEELSEKINLMGAGAKQAGLSGQQGFQTMVEWMHVAHGATGNLRKGISGVSGIIDGLASGSLRMPVLQHAMYDIEAAKKSGKDFNTIIGDIIAKTGGKQERLAQIFSGDQLKVVTEIGKTYSKAFAETSGDVKTKTAAGLAAYNKALQDTGKSALSYKDIQEEAAKEMETPEKKIQQSLERIAQMFTSDKMMKAFGQLADLMPKVVDQIAQHPLLTGAAVAGIPQAVAGAVLQGLLKGGLGGGGGGGAGNPLGQAGMIAAGSVLAYEIGKHAIDEHFKGVEQDQNNAIAEGISARNALSAMRTGVATGSMSQEQLRANRATLRESLKGIQQRIDDQMFAEGGSAGMTKEQREGASARYQQRGGYATVSKDEMKSLLQQQTDLEDALKVGPDIGVQRRGRIATGKATSEDVEAFGQSIDEGGGMIGLLNKRRGGGPVGLGNLNGGPEIGDRQAVKDALAASKAHVDTGAQQAKLLADAITGRELKVRVTNAAEIGKEAGSGGSPVPGFVGR